MITDTLYRIIKVYEFRRNFQFRLNLFSKRGHAKDLRPVVSARDQIDAVLLTIDGNIFLDAPGDKSIAIQFHRLADSRNAAAATANADAFDLFCPVEKLILHTMRKSRIEAVQKIGLRYRSTPLGDNTHSPFTFVKKALNRIESQFFRNDSIVADFGVSVQRQMEPEHGDAVIHQLAETFCKFSNRELALAFPEAIRVMDNNAIRLLGNGSIIFDCACGKGHKEWVKVADGGPYLKAKVRLG